MKLNAQTWTQSVDCFECLCVRVCVKCHQVAYRHIQWPIPFILPFFHSLFFIYKISPVRIFQPVAYKVHKFFLEVLGDRSQHGLTTMPRSKVFPFYLVYFFCSSNFHLFFVLSRLCNAFVLCVYVCVYAVYFMRVDYVQCESFKRPFQMFNVNFSKQFFRFSSSLFHLDHFFSRSNRLKSCLTITSKLTERQNSTRSWRRSRQHVAAMAEKEKKNRYSYTPWLCIALKRVRLIK